jgi:hypothetical protein
MSEETPPVVEPTQDVAAIETPSRPSIREAYDASLRDAGLDARKPAAVEDDADEGDTPAPAADAEADKPEPSEDDAEVEAAAEAAANKGKKSKAKAKAEEPKVEPVVAEADAEDADESDADEGDTAVEPTVAEQVVELLKDKKTLQAALEEADVSDIMDLPLVKELLGRERQSAIDTTKAELQRQQFEDTQVNSRLERGQHTIDEFVGEMENLLKAYEEDEDGTAELAFPTPEAIRQRFNDVRMASVEAYHNQTFADIAEVINALPELASISPEAKQELAQYAGKPPQEWLGAHLEAARSNLWNIAQQQVSDNAEKRIEDQRTLLTAAHKLEIDKLTEKHERVLTKAVEKATSNARAEAIADAASGKLPPRAPKKEAAADIDEGEVTGKSIGDIFKQLKSQAEKSGAI